MNDSEKRAKLYEEAARVERMCKGTGVHPGYCWKFRGKQCADIIPTFTSDPNEYEAALTIVENRPAFNGDTLYTKNGEIVKITSSMQPINGLVSVRYQNGHQVVADSAELSWNPLQRVYAVIEGKSVHHLDELYLKDCGEKVTIVGELNGILFGNGPVSATHGTYFIPPENLSWNPPKPKTITINGEELPAPDGGKTGDWWFSDTPGCAPSDFWWKRKEDADAVEAAIVRALKGESK